MDRTLAPSLEKAMAVALPIPDEAPVTSATKPSSLPGAMVDEWPEGLYVLWEDTGGVWE